jgi:hypothetical protein
MEVYSHTARSGHEGGLCGGIESERVQRHGGTLYGGIEAVSIVVEVESQTRQCGGVVALRPGVWRQTPSVEV